MLVLREWEVRGWSAFTFWLWASKSSSRAHIELSRGASSHVGLEMERLHETCMERSRIFVPNRALAWNALAFVSRNQALAAFSCLAVGRVEGSLVTSVGCHL